MGAQDRNIEKIEQRRADYLSPNESILVVTIANPQRTNTFFLAAALASLVIVRRFLSGGILPAVAVSVVAGILGAGLAAALAAYALRGIATSMPPLTSYLVLTDSRLVVIRCWPWGAPGALAGSFTPDQIRDFTDTKAILTSRLGIEFQDGSAYVGDVHGTLAVDFAAAANAWRGRGGAGLQG